MSSTYSLEQILIVANEREKNDSMKPLLRHLPGFVELLSAHFCQGLLEKMKKDENQLIFLNFWRVYWNGQKAEKDGLGVKLDAGYSATSSARQLTQRFIENNNKISPEIEQYFHQVLTRPPGFLDLLRELSALAQEQGGLCEEELKTGKNIAYLFRALFSAILHLTFDRGGCVIIPGVGEFQRRFKKPKKDASTKTAGGVLQFLPRPSVA